MPSHGPLTSLKSWLTFMAALKKRRCTKKPSDPYDDDADSGRLPPQTLHRRTEFVSYANTQTSYLSNIAPPPHTPPPSLLNFATDPSCPSLESLNSYGDLDMDCLHELPEIKDQHKPHRRTAADNPLCDSMPYRDQWLAELLLHEGRCGYTDPNCAKCADGPVLIHCVDCNDMHMCCEPCIVEMQKRNPLYRIKCWYRTHFRRKTLRQAGLRIQLGHPIGTRCVNPQRAWGDDFVILDISGIHSVGLDFCGCESAAPLPVQLLRASLFSATNQNLKMAATFRLMEHFHALSAQANMSDYQYYATLERRSDNTGLDTPKDQHAAFMCMIRKWRRVKMLKQAVRGHDPAGIAATLPGSCAIHYPCCPHPGKNLRPDSQDAPPERSWLYRIFVGLDVNCGLKRKKVSSDQANPGLNNAYAYFVDSDHMLQHSPTWDFDKREITFLMPKFRIPAHQEQCNTNFLFNLTKNVGCTNDEAIECGWPAGNSVASSTKEMGAEAHRDRFNDVFTEYNWREVCTLASTMLAKIQTALPECSDHVAAFRALHAALPPERTAEWEEAVKKWEADPRQPNPFEVKHYTVTQAAVRLELAQEDARRLREGEAIARLHEQVSPSVLINTGLELAEHQRRLSIDIGVLGQYSTDLQRAKLLERQNMLQRKIDTWTEIQHLFMPGVAELRAGTAITAKVPLFLPSAICTHMPCDPTLIDYEFRLRIAQAHDILDDLRRHLRLRSHLYNFKDQFICGQRPNTRAHTIISTIQDTIDADVARYCRGRDVLLVLGHVLGETSWQGELRDLEDGDVRGMTEGLFGESEGRRSLSWIWRTTGVGSNGEHEPEILQEALRVEWCKARARAHQWAEKCKMLVEEMRRILEFHDYQADWWVDQIGRMFPESEEHQEVLEAYAHQQADMWCAMRDHCAHVWRFVPEWVRLAVYPEVDETPPFSEGL